MLSIPKLEFKESAQYLALPIQSSMDELEAAIVGARQELERWFQSQNLQISQSFFCRYLIIDMPAVSVHVGFFVSEKIAAPDGLVLGVRPAGRYGVALYKGPPSQLVDANAMLMGWAQFKGVEWASERTSGGERFEARYERFESTPQKQSDVGVSIEILIADKDG